MEVLSQRRLNRALLARQLLLERAKLPIPRALERLGGIQNQYAPNAYIRLWSCLEGFERDALTRAYERGTVVQGTLMRGTIHTVSARDYRPFAAAVRRSRQEWARRIHRDDDADRAALVDRVRRALRGQACNRGELLAMRADASATAWSTIDTDAELIRVPPSGSWEHRRADIFGLADDWLPPGGSPDEDAAMEHLVRRYLGGFGPASARDISDYTHLPLPALKGRLSRMRLRRYRDADGRELFDLPAAPLPHEETPAPVRFLPTWDAVLLVHARRTQVLPEAHRPRIFAVKAPHSFPTFLVDGQVCGTWRHAEDRIELTPFERLPRSVRRELDDEAERLAAFHGD